VSQINRKKETRNMDRESFDAGWDAALDEIRNLLGGIPDEQLTVQSLTRVIDELGEDWEGSRKIVGVDRDGPWIYGDRSSTPG
jgi:hypothetical protein